MRVVRVEIPAKFDNTTEEGTGRLRCSLGACSRPLWSSRNPRRSWNSRSHPRLPLLQARERSFALRGADAEEPEPDLLKPWKNSLAETGKEIPLVWKSWPS
jgi:hypothetical protein